jgi:hypothetical protein
MGQVNNISRKKWGIGTSSFIVSIIAIMFSFSSFGVKTIGEIILDAVRIKFPVGIISTVLFVVAIFIGDRYKEHYGAKLGKNISIIFLVLMIILTIVNWFFS